MTSYSNSVLLSLFVIAAASTLTSAHATPLQLRQPTMGLPNVWSAGVSLTGRAGGTIQDLAVLGGYLNLQMMDAQTQPNPRGPVTGMIVDVSALAQVGFNPDSLFMYFRSRSGVGNVFGNARRAAFYLPVLLLMDTSTNTGNGTSRNRAGVRIEPGLLAVSRDALGNVNGLALSIVAGVSYASTTEINRGEGSAEVLGGFRARRWYDLPNGYAFGYELEATMGYIPDSDTYTTEFDALGYFRFPSGVTVNAGVQFTRDGDREEIVPMVGLGGNISP